MEGRMEGKQAGKKKSVEMIDDLREKNLYETLKSNAQDRAGWKSCWASGT